MEEQQPLTPLADIHLHFYGCIRDEDFLEYVAERDVDWKPFETAYLKTFGESPRMDDILHRHRQGDKGASREFKRLFVFGDEDAGHFNRFQAKFRLLDTGSAFGEYVNDATRLPELLDEWAFFLRRVAQHQRQQGIGYAEQRMILRPTFSQDHSRQVLLMTLKTYSVEEDAGFRTTLAVSLPRVDPWPRWEQTRELALGEHGDRLTAVDFSGYEGGNPPKDQAALFEEVLDFNRRHPERALAILYHVGETFEDKSLESAIRWVQEAAELGAHRLGHAIALGIDPAAYGVHTRTETASERIDQLRYDLKHAEGLRKSGVTVDETAIESEVARLRTLPGDAELTVKYDDAQLEEVRHRQAFAAERIKATGAVVEVCPTSNRRIGGIDDPDHHPVHRFLDWGVPFVVGSDDPGIFDTTLADEIRWVVDTAQLDPAAFDEIAARGWRYRSEVLSGRESHATG